MNKLKMILLFFLLSIFPLKSFAIFHDERTSYFFQNKNTWEIKYIFDNRDIYEWKFDESIRNYLDWKLISDNNLFKNYNFLEVDYCRRGNCNYINLWKYVITDLPLYTMKIDDYKVVNNLINSWTHFSVNNIEAFTKEDLSRNEQFSIYYKFLISDYILEFLYWLPFNLIVFFIIWELIVKIVIKKCFNIKRNLLNIFTTSLILYIISEIILYSNWYWYSQISWDLFWPIVYLFSIWIFKIILFIFWTIDLIVIYQKYRKQKKESISDNSTEKTPE